MAKRKVRFVEEHEMSDREALRFSKRGRDAAEAEASDAADFADTDTRDGSENVKERESKHTLESDEEEEEKYEKLDVESIEGQEEATEEFEGDTKITPFNMQDELEEGEFDSSGNFVFKKKEVEIQDAWLDNIDWAKVKKDAGEHWEKPGPTSDTEPPGEPVNRLKIYGEILDLMKPGETLTKTLKRLGGSVSASDARKQRWKGNKGIVLKLRDSISQVDVH